MSEVGTRSGDVLNVPVLLLNRYFAPIGLVTVRRAMVLLYCSHARALDDAGESHEFSSWRELPVRDGDDRVPIVGGALRVPRVLHLLEYDKNPRVVVRLTRRNLMLRDEHQCQYCSGRPGVRELNLDHVIPRSRGGTDSWENLVVSCRVCNLKKGRRTPEEAGMLLLRKPKRPAWSTTAQILLSTKRSFSEWSAFLKAG